VALCSGSFSAHSTNTIPRSRCRAARFCLPLLAAKLRCGHEYFSPLPEQVVVITCASSVNGRETARQSGRRGAHVVLSARGEEALAEAAA
jgi:hypothetical protein